MTKRGKVIVAVGAAAALFVGAGLFAREGASDFAFTRGARLESIHIHDYPTDPGRPILHRTYVYQKPMAQIVRLAEAELEEAGYSKSQTGVVVSFKKPGRHVVTIFEVPEETNVYTISPAGFADRVNEWYWRLTRR